MIQATYMEFRKGPGRIIGVTRQRQTLNVWAKSHQDLHTPT